MRRSRYTTDYRRRLVQAREARWNAMAEKPICKRCRAKPCMRRPWIQGNVQCAQCYRKRPNVIKSGRTNSRKVVKLSGRKIRAQSIEQAQVIRAHIRRRRLELVQRQSARAQAEGH